MDSAEGVTYRAVLGNREFAAILLSQGLSILGDQVARIALALLVFDRTGSPLAASATYGLSFLAYVVAAPLLSTLADRYPRRTIMVLSDLGRAILVLALAVGHPPVALVFILILALGLLAPAFDSARSATLPDLLPGDAYVKGSALFNLVIQGAQVVGFVAGGALLATLSTGRVLALDAGTFLVSALVVQCALRHRSAVTEPAAERGLLRETREGVRVVLREPVLLRLLAFSILGVVAGAAPEGLAIPIARELGGSTVAAGLLTAAIPAGFVLASFAVLRVPAAGRLRLLRPLALLSALPLLLTPVLTSVWAVLAVWTLAGFGSSMQLIASAAYVTSTPLHARARAYGLASTLLMGGQGVAQLITGGAASLVGGARASSYAVAALALLAAGLVSVLPGLPLKETVDSQGSPDVTR